ncbi:unnamed protein product [marine sediment metagenome]|uniref:Isochorismatase-like domain-containing protein n=1 Tax=marine sediment metagenome TaxID=412755 RepID=X1LA13_9ZZZZ
MVNSLKKFRLLQEKMGKEALLVIEMLNDFIEVGASLEVPAARKILPYVKRRIKEAREKQIPIIYICDSHRENDQEFEKWPKHAIYGTRGAEIIEELKPGKDDFIVRRTFSYPKAY